MDYSTLIILSDLLPNRMLNYRVFSRHPGWGVLAVQHSERGNPASDPSHTHVMSQHIGLEDESEKGLFYSGT
ncbi:MAG: hypothetical protein KatS3mg104_1146 [Phycisphaerae bacterium]|jgi:hypothetical protein|nr:MAG: hypothetical protein KatS3mg104_1146 [Phycisphaerae bacterium]